MPVRPKPTTTEPFAKARGPRIRSRSRLSRHSPRVALAAVLTAGSPIGETRAQESVALEEVSVEHVGGSAVPGTTSASDSIGLIGPTPGYSATRAVSATRTATPQIDVPQVVTVAPREVISDLAATRVDRVFNSCPASRSRTISAA